MTRVTSPREINACLLSIHSEGLKRSVTRRRFTDKHHDAAETKLPVRIQHGRPSASRTRCVLPPAVDADGQRVWITADILAAGPDHRQRTAPRVAR